MGPQVGRTASKVLFKRLTGVSPIISENIVRYFDDFVESAAVLFTYTSSPSCSQNLWPEFSFFLRHSEHVHCLKVFKSLKHGNVYTSPSPMSKVTGKGNLDFGLSLKSYGPPNQNRFRGFFVTWMYKCYLLPRNKWEILSQEEKFLTQWMQF